MLVEETSIIKASNNSFAAAPGLSTVIRNAANQAEDHSGHYPAVMATLGLLLVVMAGMLALVVTCLWRRTCRRDFHEQVVFTYVGLSQNDVNEEIENLYTATMGDDVSSDDEILLQ